MNSTNRFKKYGVVGLLFLGLIGLSGCSSLADPNDTSDAISTTGAHSKRVDKRSYVVRGKRYYVLRSTKGYDKIGNASWYGRQFHGHRTFSDERYNMYSMTAASTTLPISSYVRVTNLSNGRAVVVRINDRGPFCGNRLIDLSYAAAKKLGYTGAGTTKVRVTALDTPSSTNAGVFAQNNHLPRTSRS